MPSRSSPRTPLASRRALLTAIGTAGLSLSVSGCLSRLSGDAFERLSDDTSAADRRVPVDYEPGPDEWLRPTRTLSNDLVSSAAPPRASPSERWSVSTAEPVSSLAVADDVVYAGTRDRLHALSLEDGERLWTEAVGRYVQVIDGRCYTVSSEAIVARDAATGERHWRHELDGWFRDLVEVDGTVYYTDRNGLTGLHADTGERRWTLEVDHARDSTLAVADGALHWFTTESYRVLEPNGGERPVERRTVPFGDTYSGGDPGPPVLVDGAAYASYWGSGVTGEAGTVRAVTTAGIRWYRPFEPGTLPPAVLDDRLVVAGYDNAASAMDESRVATLDLETGSTRWETTVPEPVGPPAIANGAVYLGGAHPGEPSVHVESDSEETSGYDGRPAAEAGGLFAVDVDTGDLLWDRPMGGSFAGYPLALVDDSVVVGTSSGVTVLE